MEERKNILCVYNVYNRTILTPNPVDELWEHNVLIAHTHVDVIRILTESKVQFDMVFCEPILPHTRKAGSVMKQWYGEEIHRQSHKLDIQGFAFFITPDLSCIGYGTRIPSHQTFIVCNDCWTLNDEIDWRSLYFKLANQIRLAPQVDFHASEEEVPIHF